MRLKIVPGSDVVSPSEGDITAALGRVYAGAIDAVILLSDPAANLYMQVPSGGQHIEYCVGPDGPIYAADDIPLDQAHNLFLSYARGDERWKTAVPWSVLVESLKASRSGLTLNPRGVAIAVDLGVVFALVLCWVVMQ